LTQARTRAGDRTEIGALRVRTYEPGDEAAILQMFERVHGRPRSLDEWRWQFRAGPEGPALIYLLDHRGTAVGHQAAIPFAAWIDGRHARLALGCDTMILPEHRGQGGVGRLVQAFLAEPHGFDARLGFPTDRTADLVRRHGGGLLLGSLPKWVRLLTGPRELGAGGRLATPIVKLHGRLASLPSPRLEVTALDDLGRGVDELASESRSFAPCIRIRDAAYLRWRWQERPGAQWTILGVHRERELSGLAVIGVQDSPIGPRGRVVDVLARDSQSLRALLCEAVRRLAAAGCERVVCEYKDPRPWARRAFLRAGFVPLGGDLTIVGRALSERAGQVPESLGAWYLTRGDTDLA
jgi:hypothetical protein